MKEGGGKKMKRNVAKITKVITVALWVSCVLLSCMLFSGVWGRYFSQADGSDGGRVAKFDVSAAFTGSIADFTLSEDAKTVSYPFSVTSNSEVAVSYDVVLTLPSTLPSGISFSIGSATLTVSVANSYSATYARIDTANTPGYFTLGTSSS